VKERTLSERGSSGARGDLLRIGEYRTLRKKKTRWERSRLSEEGMVSTLCEERGRKRFPKQKEARSGEEKKKEPRQLYGKKEKKASGPMGARNSSL